MADKSKNNSKFKSSSTLDDISALHNINKPKNSRATGSEYETLAAAFLEQNGHTIITRNYRTRYGEIDIISKCNSTLVFTECKYRSSSKFGAFFLCGVGRQSATGNVRLTKHPVITWN